MANKKIWSSDGSGIDLEIKSSSIYYDNTTSKIIVPQLTSSNLSSSYVNGVLIASTNTISRTTASAGVSGTVLQISNGNLVAASSTTIGGDLSGSTLDLSNVKVLSVANISSGTLPYANGGTGLNSQLSGVLIKTNSGLSTIATSNSGAVIQYEQTQGWFLNDYSDPTTNYRERIDVYTTGSNNVWRKNGNPRFLRVITIGGGGGGAGGSVAVGAAGSPSYFVYGGVGGGSGGQSDIVLDATNITGAIITIGVGGSGGSAKSGSTQTGGFGASGSATIFSCSQAYIISYGGKGAESDLATGVGEGSLVSGSGGQGQIVGGSGGQSYMSSNGFFGLSWSGGPSRYTSGGGGGTSIVQGGASGFPAFYTSTGKPSGVCLETGTYVTSSTALYAAAPSPNTPSAPGTTGSASGQIVGYVNGSTSLSTGSYFGCGGSGGSSYVPQTAPAAMPAGSGAPGVFGGGGGGGGAAWSSVTPYPSSGAGGRGGDGVVIIYSY